MITKETVKQAIREVQPELIAEITRSVILTLQSVKKKDAQLMVTRAEIVRDIGRSLYDKAVRTGEIKPIKSGPSKSCTIRVMKKEYEAFLEKLSN